MSVIIKGMKKPPKCEWLDNERNLQRCKLLIDDDCALQDCDDSWTWEEQYARCPLDELPEKHGRLVEFIDVATTTNDDDGTESVNLGEAFCAYFKMRESKSVIEAEDEE